jgi:ATP-dependent DNA ligase
LRYRGHWLTERPFYERRALLEQAVEEASASGHAQRGQWQLSPLYHHGQLGDLGQLARAALRRLDAPYGRGDRAQPSILAKTSSQGRVRQAWSRTVGAEPAR